MPRSSLQFRQPAADQAAAWAARLGGGPLSDDDQRALQAWKDREPSHAALLEQELNLQGLLGRTVPEMVASGRLSVPRRRKVSTRTVWAAGLAALLALGLTLFLFTQRPRQLSTPFAQRQSLTFDDGTTADLNAHTALSVQLTRHQRHLRLAHGEAYFSVAKDANRPFLVDTPSGQIQVTGTRFNVRAADAGTLEVTVLEGGVKVDPGSGSSSTLHAGDQFALEAGSYATRHLTPEAARDAIAWRQGQIVFSGATLGEAISRFTEYDGRAISVDHRIASLRVGGTFRLDDLDGFLRDISTAIPVRVQKNPDGSLSLGPK